MTDDKLCKICEKYKSATTTLTNGKGDFVCESCYHKYIKKDYTLWMIWNWLQLLSLILITVFMILYSIWIEYSYR